MFGKPIRLAVDLIAIATILAGVRKATGFGPNTKRIKDTAIRTFLDSYFGLGDTVFSFLCGFAASSNYFRREID